MFGQREKCTNGIPFSIGQHKLTKKKLIESKVYIPFYWPNVQSWCNAESLENTLSQLLLALPIDQRYSIDEMNFIVSVLKEFI